MGVVSGLVMSYEFGTNWSNFSTFAGGVTGPLLAYEVLTAFFLEAGFLGVMLFGWRKVGPGLHFFATLMVAAGTVVSMTWILASNSWMQTPRGFAIVDGRIVPTDWLKVIFNPSFPYRLVHMGLAAYLATALFVGATGAWHLLYNRDNPRVRTMFSMAMWMLLITAPLQILAGDQHGINTLRVSARQGSRDGGALVEQPRGKRAGDHFRLAGHGRPEDTGRDRHPASGQPDPDPLLGRSDFRRWTIFPRPTGPIRQSSSGPSASWSASRC